MTTRKYIGLLPTYYAGVVLELGNSKPDF